VVRLPRSVVREGTAQDERAPSVHKEAPVSHLRVLIADDNEDGANTLATFLSLEGLEVLVAYTGEQALQMAAEHRPNVCVLDIGMLGLTGLEVAERIWREAWGRHMLLVAVTGWGQGKDKALARASGFDHHLTQPINPEALNQIFNDAQRTGDPPWAHRLRAAPHSAPGPAPRAPTAPDGRGA
jgi:CheY-like chemotaxis protein